ncbi:MULTISPECIES: hypothetical protein [Caldanaerobacter]|uniref:Lipoprotein n=2 Tax=Caldanaerobacter subterraneus TaxID=911092 RepID=U5CCZ7_CALSX|nr:MULTISPECIES: hypothetical protein [Caldanaerobacter]ERM90805.1 hypothetical protein O163_14065 [Caldanaerobacter subterraneus subsp. yonseiensis KB-1]MBE3578463.1 hypothetical protein [Caldanaerobacter subterraneus]MDI3519530.1 hypothetical protein [Caldanaerobacter sp.]MDK2794454.1 hypothetical protein [Caldanaerobacter sp.]TCO66315.1 hypothetical protein EV203_11011 [Caldanaerobacter subterraneus]
MKKILMFFSVAVLIVLSSGIVFANVGNDNIIPLKDTSKIKSQIEPLYVVYCPGGSPDGKHHFYRSGRNTSITLKDSSNRTVGTWWGIPCQCKYCGSQISLSLDYSNYINSSDIYYDGWFGLWAYITSIHPVNPEEMVLFK